MLYRFYSGQKYLRKMQFESGKWLMRGRFLMNYQSISEFNENCNHLAFLMS